MLSALGDRLFDLRERGLSARARALVAMLACALIACAIVLACAVPAQAYTFVYTYYNPDNPSQTIVIRGNVSDAGGVVVSSVTSGQQYVKDIRGTGDKSNLKDEYANWVLDETKTTVNGATGSTTTTTDAQTGETTTESTESNWLGDLIDGVVNSWADSLFEAGADQLAAVTQVDFLTGTFDELVSSSTFAQVQRLFSTVVRVVGYSILAIVFLVQLVRISNKLDGNQAVPGVKEVIFLLIGFVILKFVLDNAFELCQAVYNSANQIAVSLSSVGTGVTLPSMTDTLSDAGSFVRLFAGLLFIVISIAFKTITIFVGIARALQIYIMAVFSPIPLSMFGLEETRGWATGFVKNFIAVCLAGAIMIAVLIVWSAMISGISSEFTVYLATLIVGMYALVKSGSWARDMLGG